MSPRMRKGIKSVQFQPEKTALFQTQFRPGQVHPSAFIAQGVVVVGEVTIGEEASIWFNATLRGDTTFPPPDSSAAPRDRSRR